MILQNRSDMLGKKLTLIEENKPSLSYTYMRTLFMRHPDMFLKSYASMEGKIGYLKRNMNLQLHKQRAFPLLLHYNFTKVIYPRCEAIKRTELTKEFDLLEVLTGTDEEFCEKYGVETERLEELKVKKEYLDEVDTLWVYVQDKA